jgi:hypothetical protein
MERIVFPLIALALTGLTHWILEHLHMGHPALFSVAPLLLASWALVRVFVHVLCGVLV